MTREQAITAILAERSRQNQLRDEGRFDFTCADNASLHEKNSVLAEEAGEVARAVNECDIPNLREELVQVAAVALAWLESL